MVNRFESFVNGITVCYKYIQKIKATEMTEYGLKGTHAMCVYYLNRHEGGLTAAQLCNLCSEDKAAISRTLVDLESKGYVDQNNDENKKKYRSLITLTQKGRELAQTVDSLACQWVGLGGDTLSDEQREAFYYALEVISQNLGTGIKEKK